jgi:hypothetical protein
MNPVRRLARKTEQAGEALAALAGFTLAGFPVVSNEQYEARLATCSTCPLKDPSSWVCTDCGCYLTVKAKMATENCPKGKWAGDPAPSPASGCSSCGS